MTMSETAPSSSQAKDALDTIRESQQGLLNEFIPSVFVRLPIASSFAVLVFGYGMTEHENEWALAIWMGAIGFVIFTALYIYSYRLQGIKIRYLPRSGSSEMFNIGIGVIFVLLVLGSRFLRTELGFAYSPHISACAAGALYFWLLAKYPTGEIHVGDE